MIVWCLTPFSVKSRRQVHLSILSWSSLNQYSAQHRIYFLQILKKIRYMIFSKYRIELIAALYSANVTKSTCAIMKDFVCFNGKSLAYFLMMFVRNITVKVHTCISAAIAKINLAPFFIGIKMQLNS